MPQPTSPLVIPRPAESVRPAAPEDLCGNDWLLMGGQGAESFTEFPALGPTVLHVAPPWYGDNAGEPHRAQEVPLPEGVDLSVSLAMCLSLGGSKSLGGLTRFFADGTFTEYNWLEIDVGCGGADYDAFMRIWSDATDRQFYLNDDGTDLYLLGANAFLQWTRLPGGYVCRELTSAEQRASLLYPDYAPAEPLHHLSMPDTELCGSRWQLTHAQTQGRVTTFPAVAPLELRLQIPPPDRYVGPEAVLTLSPVYHELPVENELVATTEIQCGAQRRDLEFRLKFTEGDAYMIRAEALSELSVDDYACGPLQDGVSMLFARALYGTDHYGLSADEMTLYLMGDTNLLEWTRLPNDDTCN